MVKCDDMQTFDQALDQRNASTLFAAGSGERKKVHEHIKITEEIECEIKSWLFNLKFGHYLSKEYEHRDICSDPFSNGTLLAELFS